MQNHRVRKLIIAAGVQVLLLGAPLEVRGVPLWAQSVQASIAQSTLRCGKGEIQTPEQRAACAKAFKRFAWLLLVYGLPPALMLSIVFLRLLNRRSAWRALARDYPHAAPRSGERGISTGPVFVGRLQHKYVRAQVDDYHLHLFRRGLPPFSVPLDEIRAAPAPVPPLRLPGIRLTFARAPDVRVLVYRNGFAKIAAASGGRLRLPEDGAATAPPGTPANFSDSERWD